MLKSLWYYYPFSKVYVFDDLNLVHSHMFIVKQVSKTFLKKLLKEKGKRKVYNVNMEVQEKFLQGKSLQKERLNLGRELGVYKQSKKYYLVYLP